MIRRKDEIPPRILREHYGGTGEIRLHSFMTETDALGKGRLFATGYIEPGHSIGYHQHKGDIEVFAILQGTALICDDGEDVLVHPGDSHICLDGAYHSMKNVGDDTLVFTALILYAP